MTCVAFPAERMTWRADCMASSVRVTPPLPAAGATRRSLGLSNTCGKIHTLHTQKNISLKPLLRSHVERRCSILGPTQSRISPNIL